jgi:DNA-binding CsgD family transcriptional regulator
MTDELGAAAAGNDIALEDAVRTSSLPVVLVDLDTSLIVAASDEAARTLNAHPNDLLGRRAMEFVVDEGPSREALDLVMRGVIEGYQTPRMLKQLDGTEVLGRIWVRSMAQGDRFFLLIVFAENDAWSGLGEALALPSALSELTPVPGLDRLTPREREILGQLMAGRRVAQIAEACFLAPATVRNHLSSIFAKLGVHTQGELVALLRSEGGR